MDSSQADFPLSPTEMDRRRQAYTRLVTWIGLASLVSSLDLLVASPLVALPALLALWAFLLLSRARFFRSFTRYSRTVWSLADRQLVRSDGTSREAYALQDVQRIQVKRTVDGRIRAVSVSFAGGRNVYVNGLQSPQEFTRELTSGSGQAAVLPEIREPVAYDHPWFYRIVGLLIGLAITTGARLVTNLTGTGVKWVQCVAAAYELAFGAYWLYAMPVAKTYGQRGRRVDMAIGLASLGVGAGLAFAAIVL